VGSHIGQVKGKVVEIRSSDKNNPISSQIMEVHGVERLATISL